MKRRNFVAGSAGLASSFFLAPYRSRASVGNNGTDDEIDFGGKKVLARIGICADVHQDLMHDGERRLEAFINEMVSLKPDFIIQLGDFCGPYEKNGNFMDIWRRFKGPSFHVLGNHDTDGGFSFQQVIDYWGGRNAYYSFDSNKYHFIVLNGNERAEGDTSRWPSNISEEQIEWLKGDLHSTRLPVIIFCHQGIDIDVNGAIERASRVRVVLERANERAGYTQVRLVFSGHHHQDYHNVINGIHYVQINSMSYYWMGSKYRQMRYTETINKDHPWLKDTAPYKDPIWAFLTVYQDGLFEIKGRRTDFVSPAPKELGFGEFEKVYPVVPYISNRKIKIAVPDKTVNYQG